MVILLDILPFKTKKPEQACKMFKPTCTSVNGFYEFVLPSIDGGKGSLRVLCGGRGLLFLGQLGTRTP